MVTWLYYFDWNEEQFATGMKNNLRLFVKSMIKLKLNNSSVYSSFARSEFYRNTENQS